MAFMKKGAPPVSLSKIRNLATIIITVAKSKKNNQFQWSINPSRIYKEHREKSLPDSYYISNQTFPCDPLLLILLRYCFHIKKAIMPNRLNNKTKMTHKYLYGLVS